MTTHEALADIPNYSGMYCASAGGQIFSRLSGRLRELKPFSNGKGYLVVSLYMDKRKKQVLVHRLVLLAFIGPCPEGMQGAHLNGNRADNRLSNLRWVTVTENHSHKVDHGTDGRGERNSIAKLTEQDVMLIRRLYVPRSKQFSCTALGKQFGLSQQTVWQIVKRQRWNHI